MLHDAYNRRNKDKVSRIIAIFQQMADNGRVPNPSRFSHEDGKIYGFKHVVANKQVRFPCFQHGKIWVLTHGFFKPGAKRKLGVWPVAELEKANLIMSEYLAHS